jgi:hypothetical protein
VAVALVRNTLDADVEAFALRLVRAALPAAEAFAEVDPRVPRGSKPHPGPRLVDSFQFGAPARRGSRVVAKASNVAPHAEYTERGTQPHEIRPRSARALRFDAGGETVFAKRVQHPGTQAKPWFEQVVGDAWARALASAVLIVS